MDNKIKNWFTQIRKGYLELCTLNFIKVHKRVYGLQLINYFNKNSFTLKEGTLYPMLSRMTKDQLLSYKWETDITKGHPKKYYSLTSMGKKVLETMDQEFEEMCLNYQKIVNNKDITK